MPTLTLRAAARQLGVEQETLRKRVRRGTYPGTAEKINGAWYITVPDSRPDVRDTVPPPPVPDQGGTASGNGDGTRPGQGRDRGPDRGFALAALSGEEMAHFTHALVAPLVARLEELSRENGALREQLAGQQNAPAGGGPGRRLWAWLWTAMG